MIISSIEWHSGDEAIVIVSGDNIDVAVFSQPFTNKLGDQLQQPLHLFEVPSIYVSQKGVEYANRQSDGLGYECCGLLYDKNSKLLRIDNLRFIIHDEIPGDVKNGDMLEFSCSRIDLW